MHLLFSPCACACWAGKCTAEWASICWKGCLADLQRWDRHQRAALMVCRAVQATSVGQAVAGFGVSVLSFLTIWAAPARHRGEVRTPADVATAAC